MKKIIDLALAALAFASGVLLLGMGTVWGLGGLRGPSVWLYTMLPWSGGIVLLALAGWLFPRNGKVAFRREAVLGSIALGVAVVLLMFVILALIVSATGWGITDIER